MIDDLDKTLKELLKLEFLDLFPTHATQVEISFATPNKDSITQKPAVNFFLYDVRENLELRKGGYSIERTGNGTAVKQLPPVRVDCSYLITVWPVDESDSETEHRLLGRVMKVLLRHRQIPEACLQGSLQGQEPPLKAMSLQPSNLQSLGEFWQAMGGKPKAALNYTVTLPVPVHEPVEAGKLVISTQIGSET